MPRPDPSDVDRKKRAPQQGAEEDQELEQKAEKPREQRDARQDALGNQEVGALLGLGGAKGGESSSSTDVIQGSREIGQDGVDYGGEADAPDAPIEPEDLVRSWNPVARRGQEAITFAERVPTGVLDDEDGELAAELIADPPEPVDAGLGVRLSPEAVARDPSPLVRQAGRLTDGGPLARAWIGALSPPAPLLGDPHGRLPVLRARIASLACLLAEDALRGSARPRDTFGFASACFELSACAKWLDQVEADVRARELKLPLTVDLVAPTLAGLPPVRAAGRSPSPQVIDQVRALLGDLTPQTPASAWIASLAEAPPEEVDDDPLGVDAVLAELTGGRPDPAQGLHDAALESAEKLAAACARLRLDAAGWLLSLVDILGTQASPESVGRVAEQVDEEVQKVLQLLVEIARATRQRAVPLAGLRNGLRRAARGLELAFAQASAWVAGALVACSGVEPSVPAPASWSAGSGEARAEGSPGGDPVGRPEDDEALAAGLWTRAVSGRVDPREAGALAERLADDRPALAAALEILALCAEERAGGGEERARRLERLGVERGDDLLLAVAAQVLVDRAEDRRAARRGAARRVAAYGPSAGLTLLLRHAWPDEEANPPGS